MVNIVAVIVATVVTYLIGGLWYSKTMFQDQWVKLAGIKTPKKGEPMPDMKRVMLATAVVQLVMNLVLAAIIAAAGITGAGPGAVMGLWLWVGFVATTHLYGVIHSKRPLRLYAIETGYVLVSLLIAGAILAAW